METLMNPGEIAEKEGLLKKLHEQDCSIDDEVLTRILERRHDIVPDLAEIVSESIQKSQHLNHRVAQKGTEWFTIIHALYLLAHLRAEETLDIVLEFLSLEQPILDYWLHDLLNDDLWEIVYLLGADQIEELDEFVVNDANNLFSRLSVSTALIQIALHYPIRYEQVVGIFKRLLRLPHQETDFVGLLASELLDLKEPALKPFVLDCLERYQIWPGIVTAQEVEACYRKTQPRKRVPLDLFARYAYFRQHPYFSSTVAQTESNMGALLRQAHKS
jgi:hypothetical protein